VNLAPDRQRRQSIRALSVLTFFLFLAYMFLIWIPEIEHYYVPSETVSEAMTEQGRKVPSDRVLDELRSHRLLEHGWQNNAQLVDSAEKLLKGTVDIPGLPSMEVHLPFDPADLDRGTGQWQLHFSALVVPEILIDAYRLTGREEFYAMARDVILAWAAYEKSAWFNRGFLWNDHAVANRVRILADFWSIYRHRPDYRPEVARQIWQFAARTGAMAAKPDQYTFATNHGVMQNLSLWQVCIAFPFLSRVEQYKQLALARLKDEMGFYISPDGVVLEGSADYHEFGLFLLGAALRYSTLLGLDVPPEWAQKYQRAKQFSEEIRRPDGSLPRYGDTAGGTHHAFAPVTEINGKGEFTRLMKANEELHPDPFALYPASGYAVSWNGLNDHENRFSRKRWLLGHTSLVTGTSTRMSRVSCSGPEGRIGGRTLAIGGMTTLTANMPSVGKAQTLLIWLPRLVLRIVRLPYCPPCSRATCSRQKLNASGRAVSGSGACWYKYRLRCGSSLTTVPAFPRRASKRFGQPRQM